MIFLILNEDECQSIDSPIIDKQANDFEDNNLNIT